MMESMNTCSTTGTKHRWQPLGFAVDPTCGGMVPEDQCLDCKGTRLLIGGPTPEQTVESMLVGLKQVLPDAEYRRVEKELRATLEPGAEGEPRLVY